MQGDPTVPGDRPHSVSVHASPIEPGERLGSLDAVRGVAVLGILAMNIRNFGLPLGSFQDARWPRDGEAGGRLAAVDFWTWLVTNVAFEDKMITIFGLLFGAGIVVFGERATRAAAHASNPASRRATWLHVRRMWWLLVIGLLHAYLLWYGDILNTYAICGLAAWWMRRWAPGVLIGAGVCVLLITLWVQVGPAAWEMVAGQEARGRREPGLASRIMQEAGRTEQDAYRGAWWGLLEWRANLNTAWHFLGGATFGWWRSLGHMLIGMGLMKAGLFGRGWRTGTLVGLALAGYGLGLTLTLLGWVPGVAGVLERGPELGAARGVVGRLAWPMRFVGSLGVAVGHVGLVLLVWRALAGRAGGVGAAVRRSFEAVGRMALTNYLTHTVVCVLVFDGWAGDQWDRWRMVELYGLVAAIWLVQLVVSPLWLARFRYGPVEWAWRSLTYWRVEPMRQREASRG